MFIKVLSTIFTEEEMSRLSFIDDADSTVRITADVHGMKCSQARRFINNIINAIRQKCSLVIIHGYNHGTAIKDMLATDFSNSHVQNKYQDPYNKGITHVVLA